MPTGSNAECYRTAALDGIKLAWPQLDKSACKKENGHVYLTEEHIVVREEKTFNLRLTLEAEFPDDYEGDEDEYKWVSEWEQDLKPALLKLIFDSLRKHSSWKAHVRNRGASPLDQIEIALVKSF